VRPYLDGIEYTIIPNRSTAILAFTASKFDLTFPFEVTVPLMKDVKSQTPQAVCELVPSKASTNLLVNREAPPFDDPMLRRALALARDRRALSRSSPRARAILAGRCCRRRRGCRACRPMIWRPFPARHRQEPRRGARDHGAARLWARQAAPDQVAARNIAGYRDPAIILIDQLKEIGIDGELDPIETANWFPKLARKDYQIGLNNTGCGVDDPDQQFFENYGCGSERNYTGYCNVAPEKRFVEQSEVADREKRRRLVWDIDKQLQEDGARPIIYHTCAATCMQPQVKELTIMISTANTMAGAWKTSGWINR
jgi:peptide/nickel transport system substrate-binding protein